MVAGFLGQHPIRWNAAGRGRYPAPAGQVIGAAVVAFQIATYTLPSVELPRYVREESDIVWYPVTGSSVRDLQSQMRANGPHDDAGAFAGYTHNNTYWHIVWREGGGSCSVTDVAVATYDTVTLPMWSPPPNADSALTAEWSRFVTMLGRHEEGHRDIAIAGASEIARALAMLSPQASCSDLAAAANTQGQAILASIRVRQKEYDAETKHGARRGTALEDVASPPPPLALVIGVVAIVILVPGIVFLRRARAQ
jgi:predicted secreted Zn-dependent protease